MLELHEAHMHSETTIRVLKRRSPHDWYERPRCVTPTQNSLSTHLDIVMCGGSLSLAAAGMNSEARFERAQLVGSLSFK